MTKGVEASPGVRGWEEGRQTGVDGACREKLQPSWPYVAAAGEWHNLRYICVVPGQGGAREEFTDWENMLGDGKQNDDNGEQMISTLTPEAV